MRRIIIYWSLFRGPYVWRLPYVGANVHSHLEANARQWIINMLWNLHMDSWWEFQCQKSQSSRNQHQALALSLWVPLLEARRFWILFLFLGLWLLWLELLALFPKRSNKHEETHVQGQAKVWAKPLSGMRSPHVPCANMRNCSYRTSKATR